MSLNVWWEGGVFVLDLGRQQCRREVGVLFDGSMCSSCSLHVFVVRPSRSRVRLIPSRMEVRAMSISVLCDFLRSMSSGGVGLLLSFLLRSCHLCCFFGCRVYGCVKFCYGVGCGSAVGFDCVIVGMSCM